jgi:TRAP transporter TAXI family solute receptor
MKNARVLQLALVLAFAVNGIAHAAAPAVDKSKWPPRITFATGPVGGFGFPSGSAWASAVGAAVGIPISVEATTGMQVNPLMMEEKKTDAAISVTDTSLESWNGADWTKGKQIRSQRALAVLDPWVFQIYTTKQSGVTKLADLNGKSVNPSRRRSWTDAALRDVVAILGLKPGRITNVGPNDANSLLGDGRLDVAAVAGAVPHPAISEFEVNHDMVLVGMTKEQQDRFLAKQKALMPFTIPANSYKGQTTPVATVAAYNLYIVSKDLPDDLVYLLVKETFARKQQLAAAHKSFAQMEVKNIVYSTIPLHPGAVRFYEEQGIKIPARLMPPK